MNLTASVLQSDRPLVVDLDGTLIKSDLLIEAFFSLLSVKPFAALHTLTALRHGRAAFKARVADEAIVDLQTLPFNLELLEFLRSEKAAGRRIFLASAAHQKYAQDIADRLGLFEGVFASDRMVNLKGAAKADLLCKTFGRGDFDYAGNDEVDLKVWETAGGVVAVGASRSLVRKVQRRFPGAKIITPRTGYAGYWRALRPHQWLKNLLVFIPAFTAHHFDIQTALSVILAFISFSLCASSVYLLNDLLDLRSDRDHPTKRHRPFASGQLNLLHGMALFPIVLALSLGIALFLPKVFLLVLALYYIQTMAYSIWLKKQIIVDVVVLACLYGMRLLGGAAAVHVILSPWLLTFAVFVFLSLALVKRWTELVDRIKRAKGDPAGRGYRLDDLPVIQNMATSSGYTAVLVFGMYINSPTVSTLYSTPYLLWAIPLVLLYWMSRILLLTHRGEMRDDPVLFAAKDRTSIICAMLMIIVVVASL